MNIVRFHDEERWAHGLEGQVGTKLRHIVAITEGGVRVLDGPLADRTVEVLGPARKRQLRTFRRAGRTFGITKAAKAILDAAEQEV